jgi:exosome complex RNA-binding protein Rrp42 (RNase PH superfamily)
VRICNAFVNISVSIVDGDADVDSARAVVTVVVVDVVVVVDDDVVVDPAVDDDDASPDVRVVVAFDRSQHCCRSSTIWTNRIQP